MKELFELEPKNVIISIKPEYAVKIIEGIKTIELRRRFPTEDVKGGIAIIYASSPTKKIIGYAVIADVQKLPVGKMWEIYSKKACVTKKFFNSYFKGLEEGFAISLIKPVKMLSPLDVRELEEKFSISAPQSYRYASAQILEAVEA